MQTSYKPVQVVPKESVQREPVQKVDLTGASDSQPINSYLGWSIFLSRVFKHGTDKGLWLHWSHPLDRGRKNALRYGHFIGPSETLEDALHAAYQSIEAVVELESMDTRFNF